MPPRRRRSTSPQKSSGLLLFLFLLFALWIFFLYTHKQAAKQPSDVPPPVTISAPPANIKIQEPITIASFNIRNFSSKSRSEKELKYIALLIKPFDLVAIQELRDEDVLRRTTRILKDWGYDFGYDISPPVGKTRKELYAFLYRRDKISLLKKGRLFADTNDVFIREPYYATFKAGNFDFTVLTIHILFGENKAARRPEVMGLTNVYEETERQNPQEQDLIIVGDFNTPPGDEGWNRLLAKPSMTYLIRPPAKTTITDTSLYDNFWFQKNFVREYAGQVGIVKFDEEMFQNNDKEANLQVSDHRPIWAKFRVDLADDD